MKALIIKKHENPGVADIKEQAMRPDFIKVKTIAVALNPTDLHHAASVGRVGGIIGCDLSGFVEEVGEECKSEVKKGDAVYGVCHGANLNCEEDGAFAEHAMVPDGHIAKIPENLTFEDAATLGVGITSVGQGLYMALKLPLPGQKPLDDSPFILIYGGSTATGTLAIQYAKLSGMTVLTTSSPDNFPLVTARGADAVFDYHDKDCARKIREYTQSSLCYAFDCIGTESSYRLIADAMPETNQKQMKMASLLPTDSWPRKDVKATSILAYTSLGKAFSKFGRDFPAMPHHFDFGVMFWKLTNELLASGQLKPHPVALRTGGLSAIPDGLAELAGGKVKAAKLVYTVADKLSTSRSKVSAV